MFFKFHSNEFPVRYATGVHVFRAQPVSNYVCCAYILYIKCRAKSLKGLKCPHLDVVGAARESVCGG